MKKYLFSTFLVVTSLLVAANLFAFSDVGTHPAITASAADQSILKNYLKDQLGFKKGLEEIIFSGNDIVTLLKNGAQTEDSGILDPAWYNLKKYQVCARGLNHFFDPTKSVTDLNAGLSDIKSGFSNPIWATGPTYSAFTSIEDDPSEDDQWTNQTNEYSWFRARDAFFFALLAKNDDDRNRLFARSFRSVGQVAHLVQDMAVPAHVRNDMKGHFYYQEINGFNVGNWFGNNFEAYVKDNSSLIKGVDAPPSFVFVRDFWDTDTYDGNIYNSIGGGLAEYTNANFLSEWRMLGATGYAHPATGDGSWEVSTVTAEDGNADHRIYFKKTEGEQVDHLLANGYLTRYIGAGQTATFKTDMLDEKCYEDYAHLLIPKAIGYSAGVIDYFFRGTLEISRPNRFVYSIIDGSLDPQEFTYIKANVRNATDYNGGGDSPMGPGTLWAIAKYKKRKIYDPDLANDPPTADDREDHFSYSVSAPINGANLSSTVLQEFEFNFSGDPIPAGITDLYLQVVYQGTLGNEADTAVAVGMKDLSEPVHYVLFNATDYVFFDAPPQQGTIDPNNMFSTADDMENGGPSPEHCSLNEDNIIVCTDGSACDGGTHAPPCVYPYDGKVEIQFSPYAPAEGAFNPHVTYDPLPAGRHGRMILLRDDVPGLKAFWVFKNYQNEFPFDNNTPCEGCTNRFSDAIPFIVSQDNATTGAFEPAPQIMSFRGKNMHQVNAFINWHRFNYPCDNATTEVEIKKCFHDYWYNVVILSWPDMEDNETVAFDLETFNH